MKDQAKTKQMLIGELASLRERIAALEKSELERKQAEDALRESEEKYRTLFENAGEAILVAQDGRVVFFNPMTITITGYSGEEIAARPFIDFIHADDRDMIVDRHIRRLHGEDVPRSYDFRVLHKNGSFLWVQLDTILISWQGRPATLNFMTDITERKRAEEEVHRVNTLLNLIIENIPNMIFLKDARELRFTRFNRAGEELLGHSRGDLLGKNDYDFFPKEQADFFTQKDREVLRGKEIVDIQEETIQTRNKGERTLHTKKVPILNANKESEYLMGISEDITDRKQAEEELRASEEKYRLIFEYSPLGLLSFDEKGAIIACNNNFVKIIGSSRERLIGLNMLKLPDENIVLAVRNALMGSPGFYEGDYSSVTAEKITPVRCLFAPMDLGGGRISGGVGIIEDITDRKQAEESIRQAEENYRSIFENAQEGIYRTTPEGKFLMANQAMARILGYDSSAELKEGITDISHQLYIHPEERAKTLELLERQGFLKDAEIQWNRKDGSTIWVYRTMWAIRDEQMKLLYLEGLVTDITDRKNRVDHLRKALGGTVQAIALVVESKDPYTAGHQRRVADISRAIATEMGLSQDQIEGVRMAGIIHDIGKVSVPAEILSMPRKLTDLEFSLIQTHAQSGYDILKDIEFPWPIARMVLEHHERMNGSGYPNGLTGDDILPESRILAVADVVEAMATHRPYRAALGLDAALEEIAKNKRLLYDPDTVDACLKLFREKGFQLEVEGL